MFVDPPDGGACASSLDLILIQLSEDFQPSVNWKHYCTILQRTIGTFLGTVPLERQAEECFRILALILFVLYAIKWWTKWTGAANTSHLLALKALKVAIILVIRDLAICQSGEQHWLEWSSYLTS